MSGYKEFVHPTLGLIEHHASWQGWELWVVPAFIAGTQRAMIAQRDAIFWIVPAGVGAGAIHPVLDRNRVIGPFDTFDAAATTLQLLA